MKTSTSLLACLLFACGGSTTSTSTTTSAAETDPQRACTDTADAVAKAAQRCGHDYQANYDAFVNAVGGCPNIVRVRDEASLRATCLPSLSRVSCADLVAANLDPTCRAQLER